MTGELNVNQKGSTTLLSMMLMSGITLLCFYSLLVARSQYISNQSRAQTYLCFKDQLIKLDSYTAMMSKLNLAISVSFKLQALPKFKAIHQGLLISQQIYHFSFLHKTMQTGPCHFTQRLPFIYNLPYQTKLKLMLVRNIDGTAKTKKKKKWKVTISNYTGQKKIKPSFMLEASLSFTKERLRLLESKETAIVGWSISQVFSFLELSP